MELVIGRNTHVLRPWKTVAWAAVVAILGASAVPAFHAWQSSTVVSSARLGVDSLTSLASGHNLVYSIPATATITTAPYVIGLENLAAAAVRQHKPWIVVTHGAALSGTNDAANSREAVAVAILKSALTSLHSHISVKTAQSSHLQGLKVEA